MKKCWLIGLSGLVMIMSPFSSVQAEEISVFIHSATSVYVLDETMKAQATYSQTATNKGHLTAGHSLTLKVFDLPKGTLTAVELSVKSNKTGGAGEMTMTMDKQELWSISNSSFASESWYGEYSTEFVTIAKEVSVELKDTLVMTMQATANSLYWQSLKLTYTPTPAEPHTLTLVSQTEPTQVLNETEAGSGVLLPIMPDVDEWHFCGWVQEQVVEAEDASSFRAGTTYYLQDDATLYAAYMWAPLQTIEATTELTSGTYAIMAEHTTGLLMATDMPTDGVWPVVTQEGSFGDEPEVPSLNLMYLTEECRYEVEREGDSITIRAAETQNYVGYTNAGVLQMRGAYTGNRKWAVSPTADGSWAVHKTLNNRCYLIYPLFVDVASSNEVGLMMFYMNELLPELRNLFFFPVDASLPTEKPATRYTTYPLGYTAVEKVLLDETVEAVYLPDGRRVGTRLENLPRGLYILRQGTKTRKVWLP